MRFVGGPVDGREHPDGPYNSVMVPAWKMLEGHVPSEDDIVTFYPDGGVKDILTPDGRRIEWIEQHEYVRDGDVWRYKGKRG